MSWRVVGAVVLVVVTAGCGLGDRQHRADAIIDSVDNAFAAGSARGVLGVRVEVLKLPEFGGAGGADADPEQAPPRPPPRPPLTFAAELDFERRRAVLHRDADHPEIFDDLALYGTRLGISERDVRPWLRLRLEDLEEGTGELRIPGDDPVAIASAINPIVLLDLAAGALAGSIDRGEAATLGGVAVTRYDARFDVEKAFTKTREDHYPEEEREAIESLFDLLAIKGGVNDGAAWVDEEGRLRRFRLQLRTGRQRDFVFGVEFDMVLTDFGNPVDVDIPAEAAMLEADSVIAFLRSVVPELTSQTAA